MSSARRSLASLRNSGGYRALEGPPQLPSRCRICPMADETFWRHVYGTGLGATYEIEEGEGA